MAVIEERGESLRLNWRLGGGRNASRQSFTFSGGTAPARKKNAERAKSLVEAHGHNMTRTELIAALFGADATPEGHVPTLLEWVPTYLAERERRRDVQPDTLKRYRQILESRALPRMGHLRLTDITPEVVADWVGWMSARRATKGSRNRVATDRLLAGRTVRRAHAILAGCLGAAVPRWIPANPTAAPAGSKKSGSGLPKEDDFEGMFLKPGEVDLILAACDRYIHDLVLLAVYSGMRLGELAALDVRNVVFRGRTAVVRVRRALKDDGTIGPPKSKKSRRDLPLGVKASAMLADRVRGRRLSDLVFPSPRGGLWGKDNIRERHWRPAVAAAQRCAEHPPPVPPRPRRGPTRKWRVDEVSTCPCETRLQQTPRLHDCRHTHASMLIQAGWSPKKVQARLGHASYQTTMNIYAHLFDLGDDDELDLVDQLLAGRRVNGHHRGAGSARRPVRRVAVRHVSSRRSTV